jgi:hypothetical protein
MMPPLSLLLGRKPRRTRLKSTSSVNNSLTTPSNYTNKTTKTNKKPHKNTLYTPKYQEYHEIKDNHKSYYDICLSINIDYTFSNTLLYILPNKRYLILLTY